MAFYHNISKAMLDRLHRDVKVGSFLFSLPFL